jgi:hypothetical protein
MIQHTVILNHRCEYGQLKINHVCKPLSGGTAECKIHRKLLAAGQREMEVICGIRFTTCHTFSLSMNIPFLITRKSILLKEMTWETGK